MKLSIRLSLLLSLAVIAIIAGGMASCVRKDRTENLCSCVAEINDTLRAGHLKEAVQLTEALKMRALKNNDSLLWSHGMVLQGVNAYYQRDPGLVLASNDSAVAWLERQPLTPETAYMLARAYQTRGAYYDQFSYNPDSSSMSLRRAIYYTELSGRTNDLPQVYANFANSLRIASVLDSAAIYYHRAITVADSLRMPAERYIALYNGIASVLTDMRDFDNSAYWWQKSLDILSEMNTYDKFNTLTGYGNDLYYREDYEGANRVFRSLKVMLDSIPDSDWERHFTSVNLADTEIRLGRTVPATSVLDSAARYFTEVQPNPVVTCFTRTLQMRAALVDGDIPRALALAEKYPVNTSMRLEQLLARLSVLEEVYRAAGLYKEAYNMNIRYGQLNDSLRSYKLKQHISTINAMYQRDRRILNLEAERTHQEVRIFRLFAIMACLIALTVALVLFSIIRRGRIRRREEKMMRKIVTLRQENLRNRITPHFIYNALNHELNHARAHTPYHLDALVRLIRRQQYVTSEMVIPFKEELSFVNDYIHVMADSMRDRPEYLCTMPEGLQLDFLFPSMALQILVENAFRHGLKSLPPGERGYLVISLSIEEGDRVAVTVFNSCGSGNDSSQGSGTGLRVLVEPIRLINERNKEKTIFSINTQSILNGIAGCTATINLPLSLKP